MRRALALMLILMLGTSLAGIGARPARTSAAPSAQDPYDLCALIPTAQDGDPNTVVGTWDDWQKAFESDDPVPPELADARLCYEENDEVAIMAMVVSDPADIQQAITDDEVDPAYVRTTDEFGERSVEYLPHTETDSDGSDVWYLHGIYFTRGCYLVWGIDGLEDNVEPPPDSELRRTLGQIDQALQQRPACPEGVVLQTSPTAQPSPATTATPTPTAISSPTGRILALDLACNTETLDADGTVLCAATILGVGDTSGFSYNWFLDDQLQGAETGSAFTVTVDDAETHEIAVWAESGDLTTETQRFSFAKGFASATPSGPTPTPQPGSATATPTSGSVSQPTSPFSNPEPAPAGQMSLQAGQRMVAAGDLVWIPVWLIDAEGVANVNFEIVYDAAVVVPEGDVFRGNVLGNHAFSSNTAEAGVVLGGFAGNSNLRGTGTVAWIPYRAVGQPGQRTALTVNVTTINGADGTTLSINRIDGEILVVDENGLVPGDCDGDTLLNEVDALCALQMSVRRIPEKVVLDLDGNGTVDSRDAVLILQGVLGT